MKRDNGKGDTQEVTKVLDELNEFIHSPDSTDKAFKSQETFNAIRMMILSDEDIMANLMRYDLPNNRVILAMAGYIQKCKEHNYVEGVMFVMTLCGLLTARKGKRTDRFVDAIIGDRSWKEGQQGGGMMERAKNWFNKPAQP